MSTNEETRTAETAGEFAHRLRKLADLQPQRYTWSSDLALREAAERIESMQRALDAAQDLQIGDEVTRAIEAALQH